MNEEDRMPLADAVDARLESYAREGDFASSWAAAQRRGRSTAVVPLLVAAVVLAVVGFGMLRPEEAGDGQGSSVQVPDDGALHVGVGHAGLLDDPLEGGTARVSVVDEGVAGLRRQGGGFVVSGRSMGRTDVVFEGASGEAVIRTVRVEHEPLSPATTGWVDVPVGGSLVLQGPVSAIDVVDNGVLGVEDIGGPVFTARSQGTTDVVLGSGDRVTVVSV
ncbi:MAG: hypothetical protein KC656_21830, partial [Myxococcales bacterium]|nr:hypothetical protein [Myxococcales bacterium]